MTVSPLAGKKKKKLKGFQLYIPGIPDYRQNNVYYTISLYYSMYLKNQ